VGQHADPDVLEVPEHDRVREEDPEDWEAVERLPVATEGGVDVGEQRPNTIGTVISATVRAVAMSRPGSMTKPSPSASRRALRTWPRLFIRRGRHGYR